MMKSWLSDETGDTNIVSILIFIAVVVILYFLFRPYITEFFRWIASGFQ